MTYVMGGIGCDTHRWLLIEPSPLTPEKPDFNPVNDNFSLSLIETLTIISK